MEGNGGVVEDRNKMRQDLQGESVLKTLYVRSSARWWGEMIVIVPLKVSFFDS
jgi:hypothetical protein